MKKKLILTVIASAATLLSVAVMIKLKHQQGNETIGLNPKLGAYVAFQQSLKTNKMQVQKRPGSTNVLFRLTIDLESKCCAVLDANNIFTVKDADDNTIWSADITEALNGFNPVTMELHGKIIQVRTDYGLAFDGGVMINLTNKMIGLVYQ